MTPTTETTCGHWRVGVPGHVVCGKPVPEGSRYCLDCTRADERRAASPVSATSKHRTPYGLYSILDYFGVPIESGDAVRAIATGFGARLVDFDRDLPVLALAKSRVQVTDADGCPRWIAGATLAVVDPNEPTRFMGKTRCPGCTDGADGPTCPFHGDRPTGTAAA